MRFHLVLRRRSFRRAESADAGPDSSGASDSSEDSERADSSALELARLGLMRTAGIRNARVIPAH